MLCHYLVVHNAFKNDGYKYICVSQNKYCIMEWRHDSRKHTDTYLLVAQKRSQKHYSRVVMAHQRTVNHRQEEAIEYYIVSFIYIIVLDCAWQNKRNGLFRIMWLAKSMLGLHNINVKIYFPCTIIILVNIMNCAIFLGPRKSNYQFCTFNK